MALSKQVVIDQITVTENGTVLVREVTRIMEDDIEISKQYHRTSLMPAENLTGQPDNVVAIATAAWTPEIIAGYQKSLEKTGV